MSSPLKNKTYEEIYGIECADEQKKKRGSAIQKWHHEIGFNDATIQKMKKKQKELWDSGFYSKRERGEKISSFMKSHNPMKNPETVKKNIKNRKKIDISGNKNPAYRGVFHVTCLNCGNDISGAKWEVENRKFCSVKCRHEYYRGDNHPSKRPDVKEKQRTARLSQIKKNCGDLQVGRNETKILDGVEKILGYKILRDFRIIGYKPDGYVKELNLIVEVDEKHHFNKNGEYCKKDLIRQNLIENELGCKFLRIRDNGNINHSILIEAINKYDFL